MTATPARRAAAFAFAIVASLAVLSGCSDDTDTNANEESESTTFASQHCKAGVECASPEVELGETTLQVTAEASKFSQTVSVELVDDRALNCDVEDAEVGGAMAIFSNTVPDAAKTVTYTLTGDAAEQAAAAYEKHPAYLLCYGSPKQFEGITGQDTGRAKFVREDGLYEAALVPCEANTTPCFTFEESDGTVTITVEAPAGDPHMR